MRVATAVAAGIAAAAAVMAVLAFTTGGEGGEEAATAPPAPAAETAGVRSGLDVWVEHGCGSCHTLAAANSHGFLGPDLASSLKGVPASYVKESIVAPNKAAAAGYTAGMMPGSYAGRIDPTDLDRLVTFLLANARR